MAGGKLVVIGIDPPVSQLLEFLQPLNSEVIG